MLLGNWHRGQFILFVSLFLATVGIGFSYYQEWQYAMIVFILATLADSFALSFITLFQLNEAEWAFAKEMHHIEKFVVFGLLPGLFSFFFSGATAFSLLVLVIYVFAAGLRLSYYNMATMYREEKESGKTYGLKLEYVGIIFPIFSLLALFIPRNIFIILLFIVMIACSGGYLLRYAFPTVKPKYFVFIVGLQVINMLFWLFLGNIK